jgi:hypothetical protein
MLPVGSRCSRHRPANQLKFASGSLVQHLSVHYAEKLGSNTVDDLEGKLVQFLPDGESVSSL